MAQAQTAKAQPRKGWFTINIGLVNDQEDTHVFVGGCEEGDFRIKRGEDVVVPASVVQRLQDAVIGVPETDPQDETKVRIVDRQRFPLSIKAAH